MYGKVSKKTKDCIDKSRTTVGNLFGLSGHYDKLKMVHGPDINTN